MAFTSQKTARRMNDWLDWTGSTISYLFCIIYHGKAIDRSLSTCTVKRMIKTAAKNAGLGVDDIDAFNGNSLRVGAAQDLLGAGYNTAAIMRAGGWISINVLSHYLEMAEHNVWA
jgi:integrase/recombinase XerD